MSGKEQIKAEVRKLEAAQSLADVGMALFGALSLVAHRVPSVVSRHVPALQSALERWESALEAEEAVDAPNSTP
jgi:hypothetical protein